MLHHPSFHHRIARTGIGVSASTWLLGLNTTVALFAQDVLIDYVVTMMRNAVEESSKRGKLAVEDLIYLVRKVRHMLSSDAHAPFRFHALRV